MANNWDSKKRMDHEANVLKSTKVANEHADMEYKKQLWRSIMSQKMGLK